jgi:hypothetical protein
VCKLNETEGWYRGCGGFVVDDDAGDEGEAFGIQKVLLARCANESK